MVKTLVEELQALIQSEANNYPVPQRCKIIKVYADMGHVDVTTDTGTLTYVECYGGTPINDCTGLLIYLNTDMTDYVIII